MMFFGTGYEISTLQMGLVLIIIPRNNNNHYRVDPFHTTGLFLYPLRTSENKKFPGVCRGYKRQWHEMG